MCLISTGCHSYRAFSFDCLLLRVSPIRYLVSINSRRNCSYFRKILNSLITNIRIIYILISHIYVWSREMENFGVKPALDIGSSERNEGRIANSRTVAVRINLHLHSIASARLIVRALSNVYLYDGATPSLFLSSSLSTIFEQCRCHVVIKAAVVNLTRAVSFAFPRGIRPRAYERSRTCIIIIIMLARRSRSHASRREPARAIGRRSMVVRTCDNDPPHCYISRPNHDWSGLIDETVDVVNGRGKVFCQKISPGPHYCENAVRECALAQREFFFFSLPKPTKNFDSLSRKTERGVRSH